MLEVISAINTTADRQVFSFYLLNFPLLIACCVMLFAVQIIIEQSVSRLKRDDATMLNPYAIAWLKKIFCLFTVSNLHIVTFYHSVLKLRTGFAIAAFIDW